MHSICYFVFEEERLLREFLDKYQEFKIYDRDSNDQVNYNNVQSSRKDVGNIMHDRAKVYPL